MTPKYCKSIGPDGTLSIQCKQWGNGQKFLSIAKSESVWWWSNYSTYLPDILVPQGAYKFVAVMDDVIRKLPVKEPEHPACFGERPLILATQMVAGAQHYDFKLSALHQKGGGCNFEIRSVPWHFDIRTVPTSEAHEESRLLFPFWALPWLRKQIITILAEHDGSQWIKEMPKIPEWAKREEKDAGSKEGNEQSELGPNENVVPQQQIDEIINFSLKVPPNRKLFVEFDQQTENEEIIKTIRITMFIIYESSRYYESLPRILIPQVAYKFLGALDRLIGQLPAEERMVRRRIVDVEHYNFKLVWHQGDGWHFHIRSVQTVQEHKPKQVKIPIWALPWLRQQMAKILVNHDGSEPIGEIPTIPRWITRDAPNIEQQEKQPNKEKEQVTKKKADDDDEDSPCCSQNVGSTLLYRAE